MTLASRKHNTRSAAAAFPPASCVVGALLISISSPAAGMVECHARRGGDGAYWSWREIDRRRCWYRGHRGLNKHALHWPAATAEPVRARSPTPPPSPRPSPPPPDVAADAGAVLNTISDRWPDADWTETAQRLFEEAAAVTATAPLRRVPNDDADADANLDRRHPPATPKTDTRQGRSTAVALAVLMVSLGMIGAGAFLIKMRA